MPIFVLLDATIYSVIRVVVGANVVTSENYQAITDLLIVKTASTKTSNIMLNKMDNSVYLDCIYISSNTAFEPELLYVLMNQIVQYMPKAVPALKEAWESNNCRILLRNMPMNINNQGVFLCK